MSDVENNATDDIRADIAAALGAEEESNDVLEPDHSEPSETTEEPSARDESGRFSKQEPQLEQTIAPIEAPAKKAPQSWKQELKDNFNTLPPEVQDEILRRETDYSKGIQKYAEDAKYAQTLKPVIEQWMPYLSQKNVTPEQAFHHLIKAEYELQNGSPTQKRELFLQWAKQYGVDLQSLQNTQETQHQLDPNLQHALSEVQQMRQYIQNMEYTKKQEVARQQQIEQAELIKQVESFASSPDVPYFEEVKADMGKFLDAGYATDLKDAYDKACWARPDIRASLLKAEESKRILDKVDLANKAKAKAVSVTGYPSGAAVPVAGASIRDDLLAAMGGANRL